MSTDWLPPEKARKCGRPRVIPPELKSLVAELYESGYGYRAIANYLRRPEYGINPHFSSVRKLLVELGKVNLQSKSGRQV
ncbi:MAG: hypothetical protein ACW97O_16045 [Candidatus Thorarchaeota archaeon]